MNEDDETIKRFAWLAGRVFLFMGLAFLALYKLPGLIRGLNQATRIAEGKIEAIGKPLITEKENVGLDKT